MIDVRCHILQRGLLSHEAPTKAETRVVANDCQCNDVALRICDQPPCPSRQQETMLADEGEASVQLGVGEVCDLIMQRNAWDHIMTNAAHHLHAFDYQKALRKAPVIEHE